jgi:nicotinamide mononucleotide (NMN) deamidase PncC
MVRGATAADIRRMARRVLDLCRTRGLRVVTAESCTGGLVAGALTEIAGSSDVVDRGFVTSLWPDRAQPGAGAFRRAGAHDD